MRLPVEEPVRHSWVESERFLPARFVRPALRFMGREAAGGLVMLGAAVVALLWANGPWGGSYEEVWETPTVIELSDLLDLELTLREWVNDAAMVLFFFVVALEIKRELVSGHLRDRRAAALPAIAAVGGVVVPAGIYLAFNAGSPAVIGWGIPMATDIAFALAVVALLHDRVPGGAKVFLLTLAIVDDIIAILVIAVFYTEDLAVVWLLVAIAAVGVAWFLRNANVRSITPYIVLGVASWFALHESGVHATLVGVAFGLLTPAWSFYDPARFGPRARQLADRIDAQAADGVLTYEELERADVTLQDVERLARESASPLDRLEDRVGPWVSFIVIPVFALANAGVRVRLASAADLLDPVILGIAVGLVVGKTLGISLATWLAVRLGVANLPRGMDGRHLVGVSATAGIGFTVALFVTTLAFVEPVLVRDAKIAILGGSVLAGLIGYAVLRTSPRTVASEDVEAAAEVHA